MEEQLQENVVVKTVTCPECGNILDVPFELPKSAEAEEKVDIIEQFCEMTANIEGAPGRAELEEMKKKHGEIYMFPFNDKMIMVYRPVLAGEYERIMDAVARLVGANGSPADAERELGRQLCYKCVCYPKISPGSLDTMAAGVVPTMANLIHMVSGFFTTPDLQNMIMEA